jgi:hypothetical protein
MTIKRNQKATRGNYGQGLSMTSDVNETLRPENFSATFSQRKSHYFRNNNEQLFRKNNPIIFAKIMSNFFAKEIPLFSQK